MAANTVSTEAPFTPIVLRGGDKLYPHVSPVGLHTNHLAPSLGMAQKLTGADWTESGATAELSHWTQPIAKSVTACSAPAL
jgi:hypothetical protein